MALRTLFDSYEKGTREWGNTIARVDALARAGKPELFGLEGHLAFDNPTLKRNFDVVFE